MNFEQVYLFTNLLSVGLLVGLTVYLIIRVGFMGAKLQYQEAILVGFIVLIIVYSKLTAIGVVTDQFMR